MASIVFPPGFMKIDFRRYYQTTPCARGRMRCLAMLHLQKGKKIKEVCEIVQQSRVSVHSWLGWLKEEKGIERLIGYVKGRGRKSKLSFIDVEEIKTSIEKLQEERCGGRVTGKDIQTMIQEKWNISYARSSIYSLLGRLKVVWSTSRSQHPQGDKKAQEDFKKTSLRKSRKFYPPL